MKKKKNMIIVLIVMLITMMLFFSPYKYQKQIVNLFPDFVEKNVRYVLNGIYNNLPEKIKYSLHLLGLEEKLWVSKMIKLQLIL